MWRHLAKFAVATGSAASAFVFASQLFDRCLSEEEAPPVPATREKLIVLGSGWGAAALLSKIDTRYVA